MTRDNEMELLEALESHRAYARIMFSEIVRHLDDVCDIGHLEQAYFAFETEDDRLAALLAKLWEAAIP